MIVTTEAHPFNATWFSQIRSFCKRKVGRTAGIGSSAGDCAPAPSHTTGYAVFRIRRLNPAALLSRKIGRQKKAVLLVHHSPSKGSRIPGCRPAAVGWQRLHRLVPQRSQVGYRSCCAWDSSLLFFAGSPVPSLAPFFGSSALRSTAVTRLPRYYGLC